MKRGTRTTQIADGEALTTSYEALTVDIPSIIGDGGQVVLTFKRTNGTSITFKIEEQFSEDTGFVPRTEDDGTNLNLIERTSTEASFSYAFTTLADKLKVWVKGAGSEELDAFITVGEVA